MLTGTITLADGKPASGYRLRLVGHSVVPWEREDEETGEVQEGIAGLQVGAKGTTADIGPDGHYRIQGLDPQCAYSGYILSEATSEIVVRGLEFEVFRAGETREWNYVVGAPIRVYGHVYGKTTGKPIGGIFIHCGGARVADVEEDGSYEVRMTRGPGQYVFSPLRRFYGHVPASWKDEFNTTINLKHGDDIQLDLTIYDTNPVVLTITDENGNPIENAQAWIHESEDRGNGTEHRYKVPERSDRQGRIEVKETRPGAPLWYRIEHEGYVAHETEAFVLPHGYAPSEMSIVLYEAGGIRGRAVYASGQPVTNANLDANDKSLVLRST